MRGWLVLGLVGLGLMVGGSGAEAQSGGDVTVAAEATPGEVGTDESVTVTIRVEGVPRDDVSVPSPPTTDNLALRDPVPTTREETSFEGGRLTRETTITWVYEPVRVGTGRIHPVTIRVRDGTYTTEEMRVQIVSPSDRTGAAGSSSGPTAIEPPSEEREANQLDPRDVFIQTTASAQEVYRNEQVVLEYRLFFRPGIRLRQSRMADSWDAPGFWREELDVASRPTPRLTEAFGQTYKTIVLKRVALFPTRTGTLRVDPLRIETEAQAGDLDRNESVPRTHFEPVTLVSEATEIEVNPLPANPPPSFAGAVGQFSLETTIDRDSVEVGEALEVVTRVQGTGNLVPLSSPLVDPPSDFDAYDPSTQTELKRDGEAVRGTKTFTHTLVPRSNGTYTLPPVAFAYFDPETAQYETRRSAPMTIQVTGDVEARATAQTGRGLPVGDIAGPMEDDVKWVRTDPPPLYRQLWPYVALLVPVVLAVGGGAYRRYATRGEPTDPDASTRDLSDAQSHLHDARRHLRDGAVRPFHAAIERAVWAALEARRSSDQAPTGRSREALDQWFSDHDLPASDRRALRDVLDDCERAQYTPTTPSHASMEATLDHVQTLLRRLDEALQAPREG